MEWNKLLFRNENRMKIAPKKAILSSLISEWSFRQQLAHHCLTLARCRMRKKKGGGDPTLD